MSITGLQAIRINATITAINRPTATGPGGDVVNQTLFEGEIPAVRAPFNAFATAGDTINRDEEIVSRTGDNSFWIDLEDATDVIRKVKAGDVLSWVSLDATGPTGSDEEIVRANIWEAPGLSIQHVEILARGLGID